MPPDSLPMAEWSWQMLDGICASMTSVGATLAELQTRARVRTLRMSPDSRRLVTVPNFKGKVVAPELWDVEHYQPVTQLDSKGQGQVYSARFIAGGQVITACGDGAVRLWGAEVGELQRTYRGGSRFLVDATLSADGTMLIGGGGDGQLRFWEAASGRPLWTMPAHRSHLIGVHIEGADIVIRGFRAIFRDGPCPNLSKSSRRAFTTSGALS